jgi:hypothetical protein
MASLMDVVTSVTCEWIPDRPRPVCAQDKPGGSCRDLHFCRKRRQGALFQIYQRRDVKSLAKSLIAKFGSFAVVIFPLLRLATPSHIATVTISRRAEVGA